MSADSLMVDVLLLAVRLGAMLVATPLLGMMGGPVLFRVVLVLGLSVALAGPLGAHAALGPGEFLGASLREFMVGLCLGFGIHAAFAALAMAGRILEIQLGLGLGAVFDPVTRNQMPTLAVLLSLYGSVLFFISGAHHGLIRAIAFSVERIPLGAALSVNAMQAMVAQFGLMFTFAVTLAAPALLCMLLLEVGLSVVSRVLPQMNIIFVSVPLKLAVGLGVLAIAAQQINPLMLRLFRSIFEHFERVAA